MISEPGTSTSTLVISQYEKNNTLHYTLRVYSASEFKLSKVEEPYIAKYEKRVINYETTVIFIDNVIKKSVPITVLNTHMPLQE